MIRPATAILGVVLAGGPSSRYGSPKALATVGGRRVVDRAADALRAGLPGSEIVAIVNDPALAVLIGLPHRPDVLTGIGPLAGLHAALLWAAETERTGIVVAGCDMPFIAPGLVRALAGAGRADAVLPASPTRRGMEPLCAYYSTACIRAVEVAAARGDTRMVGFHTDVRLHVLPEEVVRRFGDPARMFLNVNTAEDRIEADRLEEGTT
ncbi:MAG TPA: molybdenum cofactor guanylyltransferase [Longimicrobiales bacterium]|nr:molybdenum cofactor guanylyltransferase [Longimicrobiales bacterium]